MSKPLMSCKPDQRNAVAVAGAAERADLGDALPIENARGALLVGGLGVVDQSLPVDDETRVQAPDAGDAADHLATDRGQHLPKQALVTEARQDLDCVVGLPMIDRKQPRKLRRRVGGSIESTPPR